VDGSVPEVPWVPPLRGTESVNQPNLESRIHAMAQRWSYSDAELAQVLADAVTDPAACRLFVEHDEGRRH
jgi:hypothetical protein